MLRERTIYQNVSTVLKIYLIFLNKTIVPGKYQAIYESIFMFKNIHSALLLITMINMENTLYDVALIE